MFRASFLFAGETKSRHPYRVAALARLCYEFAIRYSLRIY